MRFDVYADLDHLYMINFSVDAARLAELVPPPLRVLQKRGRGFPSVVLPSIERLRPVLTRFPAIDYELCGLRILVEYDSKFCGATKGIYFARLIMDPERVRRIANLVTAFDFEPGSIGKRTFTEDGSPDGAPSADLGPGHRREVKILQIADPHPNYVAWPLVGLAVNEAWVQPLHDNPLFAGPEITPEPSYFVGRLPRYWR